MLFQIRYSRWELEEAAINESNRRLEDSLSHLSHGHDLFRTCELLFTNSNMKTPIFVFQVKLESYLDMAWPCYVPSLSWNALVNKNQP